MLTSDQITALRSEFLQAWEDLKARTEALQAAVLADAELPLWVHQEPDPAAARSAAARMLGDYKYDDGQGPTSSKKLPGLVGASDETLALAIELNEAKKRFKTALDALAPHKILVNDDAAGRQRLVKLKQYALQKAGLADLHYRQSTRTLNILAQRPARIGFVWANTPSIERLTKAEARKLLSEMGDDDGIQEQLSLLAGLPEHEPLARVNPGPVHVRINLLWEKEGKRVPAQIKGYLPILVRCQPGESLPPFTPLKDAPEERGFRLERRDRKIEREPFLAAIHAHRYMGQAVG